MPDLPPEAERLITAKEFAEYLGISTTSLKRRRATPGAGLPKPVKIGRCVRWRLSTILQFIADLES